MTKISAEFAAQDAHDNFCNVLTAWGAFEKETYGDSPVDANLIGYVPQRRYTNRLQVRDDLTQLYKQAQKTDPFTGRRVEGFLFYLDELERPKTSNLQAYFTRMTGIVLQYYPPSDMARARVALMDGLSDVNVRFKGADVQLKAQEAELEGTALEGYLRARIAADLALFQKQTGIDVAIDYTIRVVDEAASWGAWCRGDHTGVFDMAFNKRNLGSMSPSLLLHIARHELLGHAVMRTLSMNNIRAGVTPKSHGVTTTAGFEMVQSEALAESAALVVSANDTPLDKAWNLFFDYTRRVQNNAFLLQDDQRQDRAIAYMNQHAASEMPKNGWRILQSVLSANPKPRLYQPLYAPVRTTMTRAAQQLGVDGFGRLMGELYPVWGDANALNTALAAHGVVGTDMHVTAKHIVTPLRPRGV